MSDGGNLSKEAAATLRKIQLIESAVNQAVANVNALTTELSTIATTTKDKGAHLDVGLSLTKALKVGAEAPKLVVSPGASPKPIVTKSMEPIYTEREKNVPQTSIEKRTIEGQEVEVHKKGWKMGTDKKTVPSDDQKVYTQYLGEKEREKYKVSTEKTEVSGVHAREQDRGQQIQDRLEKSTGGKTGEPSLQQTAKLKMEKGQKVTETVVPGNTSIDAGKAEYQKDIFVMDKDKNIYAGNVQKTIDRRGTDQDGDLHHSSFLEGEDVAGAGELFTDEEGVLKKVSNRSGHYKPGEDQTRQTLEALQEKGVNLDNVRLEQYSKHGEDSGMAQEFLQGGEKLFHDRHALLDEMKSGKGSPGAIKFERQKGIADAQSRSDARRREVEEKLSSTQDESEKARLKAQLVKIEEDRQKDILGTEQYCDTALAELEAGKAITGATEKSDKLLHTSERKAIAEKKANAEKEVQQKLDENLKTSERNVINQEREEARQRIEEEMLRKDAIKYQKYFEKEIAPKKKAEVDKLRNDIPAWQKAFAELQAESSRLYQESLKFTPEDSERVEKEKQEALAQVEHEANEKLQKIVQSLPKSEEEYKEEAKQARAEIERQAQEELKPHTLPEDQEKKIIAERDQAIQKATQLKQGKLRVTKAKYAALEEARRLQALPAATPEEAKMKDLVDKLRVSEINREANEAVEALSISPEEFAKRFKILEERTKPPTPQPQPQQSGGTKPSTSGKSQSKERPSQRSTDSSRMKKPPTTSKPSKQEDVYYAKDDEDEKKPKEKGQTDVYYAKEDEDEKKPKQKGESDVYYAKEDEDEKKPKQKGESDVYYAKEDEDEKKPMEKDKKEPKEKGQTDVYYGTGDEDDDDKSKGESDYSGDGDEDDDVIISSPSSKDRQSTKEKTETDVYYSDENDDKQDDDEDKYEKSSTSTKSETDVYYSDENDDKPKSKDRDEDDDDKYEKPDKDEKGSDVYYS